MGLWQISKSLRALKIYKKYNQIKTCSRVLPKGQRSIFPSKPLPGSVQHTHIHRDTVPRQQSTSHTKKAEERGFVWGMLAGLQPPAPFPKKKKVEKQKQKQKPCCFELGPNVAMDPKQTPACSRWAYPTGREHWFWNDCLETKWIHGIWCGIKIIKCDTHEIQILHPNLPNWEPPALQINQWVLSAFRLALKEISVLCPSALGVHLTGPGSLDREE